MCETVSEVIPLMWGYCGMSELPGAGACLFFLFMAGLILLYFGVVEFSRWRKRQ